MAVNVALPDDSNIAKTSLFKVALGVAIKKVSSLPGIFSSRIVMVSCAGTGCPARTTATARRSERTFKSAPLTQAI